MKKNAFLNNINGLNSIRVKCGSKEMLFLCDTGASFSCIFSNALTNLNNVDKTKKIKIIGIPGSTFSRGSANISITINNVNISHEFNVIESFDSIIQGVLGSDF